MIRQETPPRWRLAALSAALFAAILGLRLVDESTADALLVLFVIPIAICAMEFGLRGGLVAAGGAIVLLVVYEVVVDAQDIGALGVATRGAACLIVGVLLGGVSDERRALAAKLDQHYSLSLDLFCTANFDGYFEELNPAWERALGHPLEELRSRPFMDFVHPEDREATEEELTKLSRGIDTHSFRNRYRTADGQYRWLEWNVHPDPDGKKLYATARDITIQREAEVAALDQHEGLERTVRERTRELEDSRLEVLRRLAVVGEYRDDDTYQHTERVGRTAARIARRLDLSAHDVELIRRAAPLHDIGKVGIPDAILMKQGSLTDEEFRAMQAHVLIGARILAQGRFAVLHVARAIALSHHERWDGSGYPYGLAGDSIPLVGRIAAVADVFDALTHERPYKPAWPVAAAVAEIEEVAGTHFDPDVVEAFLGLDHARLLHPVRGLRTKQSSVDTALAAR
jgi:PAS domain S-box-containing protein/putative nucleotidyltransferase with HDIG domain